MDSLNENKQTAEDWLKLAKGRGSEALRKGVCSVSKTAFVKSKKIKIEETKNRDVLVPKQMGTAEENRG